MLSVVARAVQSRRGCTEPCLVRRRCAAEAVTVLRVGSLLAEKCRVWQNLLCLVLGVSGDVKNILRQQVFYCDDFRALL